MLNTNRVLTFEETVKLRLALCIILRKILVFKNCKTASK